MFLRMLCCALIIASTSLSRAQAQGCNSLEIPVGVVNANGESFHGLSSSDFAARAAKGSVTVKSMNFDDGPRRILLVVDGSKKLSPETRKAEEAMVQTILDAARPQDSFALVTARGPQHVVKFGEQRSAIMEALPHEGDTSRGKETGVLDAVMQGISLFGDAKAGDSMIVIAADLEGSRTTNAKRVAKALQEHSIRMFGLALGLVATRNVAASGQSTTAWGLATATSAVGDVVYNTGDEDFFPLTTNSGGLVIAVMNNDYRRTYSMKDPKFEARIKQGARAVYNMIAGYYRLELQTAHTGEWSFEPAADVRKAAPNMFVLYPHELPACTADSHLAKTN